MKTTKRFDNAVRKLYNAFHAGELEWSNCSKCAVGNICDGQMDWSDAGGFQVDRNANKLARQNAIRIIKKTGYSKKNLIKVEELFITGCVCQNSKEYQFKGLCAVVEYLCELDNIPNVMDYTSLFEYKDKIKELAL